MSEVDELIMWVKDMREKYYGVDGERIFENAAQIMSTDKSKGIVYLHILAHTCNQAHTCKTLGIVTKPVNC